MKRNQKGIIRVSVKAISIILSCILIISSTIPAYAYTTCGYKLKGSWYDEYYYVPLKVITYNGTTVDYEAITQGAVTWWNAKVQASTGHSLDINLSETSNGSALTTRVAVSVLDRGATGWRGHTYYHDYNFWTGTWYDVNYGGYPDQNYRSGSAVINLYYVHSNPSWKIKNTIMHEMGHIFGLKHSSVTGALMVSDSANYTSLHVPQTDDINGVRSIYE